jgi:hypothetical protein
VYQKKLPRLGPWGCTPVGFGSAVIVSCNNLNTYGTLASTLHCVIFLLQIIFSVKNVTTFFGMGVAYRFLNTLLQVMGLCV